jgi:hypothetical protein
MKNNEVYKTIKVIKLTELESVNNSSIKKGYNRNLYFDDVIKKLMKEMNKNPFLYGSWKGMETKILLEPIMVHAHKDLKPCEEHMRCVVEVGGILKGLTLDVPMDNYEEMPSLHDYGIGGTECF